MISIKITERDGIAKCRVKTRCIGKRALVRNIVGALGAICQLVKKYIPEMTPEELMEMARKAEDDGAVMRVENKEGLL